jgi:hypothetical protein
MWEPRCLTTLWASTACYRDNLTLFLLFFYFLFCLFYLNTAYYAYEFRHNDFSSLIDEVFNIPNIGLLF